MKIWYEIEKGSSKYNIKITFVFYRDNVYRKFSTFRNRANRKRWRLKGMFKGRYRFMPFIYCSWIPNEKSPYFEVRDLKL